MIDDDDLDAAAAAGIVTEQQADALRVFTAERSARNAVARADDERFRFLRGFNDVFFAVGIILFGLGLGYFANIIPFGHVIAIAITWALAELVVRRLRLVLPGILLACIFVYFVVFADWQWIIHTLGFQSVNARRFSPPLNIFAELTSAGLAVRALIGSVAAAVFYARFKLPFALLLIAAGLVIFVQLAIWHYFGSNIGFLFASLVLLLCGLAVFATAMAFDLSDRERVTRRADCAFWLHLLAAPLMVQSIIQLLVPGASFARLAGSLTTLGTLIVLAVIAVLTVIALLIDRRALFVSALSYLGIVIGYTISAAGAKSQEANVMVTFATLFILGAMVLALGIAWQPLRRVIMSLFPSALTDRLPRAAPAR